MRGGSVINTYGVMIWFTWSFHISSQSCNVSHSGLSSYTHFPPAPPLTPFLRHPCVSREGGSWEIRFHCRDPEEQISSCTATLTIIDKFYMTYTVSRSTDVNLMKVKFHVNWEYCVHHDCCVSSHALLKASGDKCQWCSSSWRKGSEWVWHPKPAIMKVRI